ncbi:DUF1304 domain-containing protein [Paenibacillus sp. SYP-B4298]|uniref:DUF1304 domain-containing protein n=1 Tax=Paenibacillus sp. SYP-B4298 TaxID=2996034 RepID=UPI0022DDF3FF|nr:DUF1304 domain-containing protein [Paenibacillus sp. SYP-B4298]
MLIASIILVAIVAIEHVYILILEMFLWTKPAALRTFNLTPSFAQQTKGLAANQGLYNGFLAAGLIFGLLHPDDAFGRQLQLFFLICVLVAAIFGALTSNKSILLKQGLPAALALICVLLT